MPLAETMLSLATPAEMARQLAARAKHLRLLKGFKRTTLALRSGVSPASLKRFESTGQISLVSLLKIAHALARLDEFNKLLQPPTATSIEELEKRTTQFTRKRGRL